MERFFQAINRSSGTYLQCFEILVAHAEQTISKSFELQNGIEAIEGIMLASDKQELLYFRGANQVEINDQEYFPEGYESKFLMHIPGVPPLQSYYNLDCMILSDECTVRIKFIDIENARSKFEPYKVLFYFRCAIRSTQPNQIVLPSSGIG